MDNIIHPTAIIDESAQIGVGNYIGPYTVIGPRVEIGHYNRIEGHASIGQPAEHKDYFKKNPGRIVIGSRNVIREFVTINAPTFGETRMGDNCIMLRGSHLSHDSILEDKVTVSCNVLIGGESYVFEGANLGLGCILHQRQIIGAYAMIGMGAVLPKKLEVFPGCVFAGNPAKLLKKNEVGVQRGGVSHEQMEEFIKKFKERRYGSV